MLQQVYSIEPVRQFLLDSGARRLDDEDEELPQALQDKPGEHWLYPSSWKHAEHIVISLGETYPDDPPALFLPQSRNAANLLLPHVAANGDICTLDRSYFVDPSRPLEVLQECLAVARGNLDRDWTDEELAEQINPEIAAYWDFLADKTLLFFRDHLSAPALHVLQVVARRKMVQTSELPAAKLSSSACLAVTTELQADEAIPFLRDPRAFLSRSHTFHKAIDRFATELASRNDTLKTFDLFIILVARLENKDCVLAGRVPQAIQAKRKSAEQLRDAIMGVVAQKRLTPWRAEDISTRRLLIRSMGPHFEDKRLTHRVAIVGCGSLGSLVADGLARGGIRCQFLCDPDFLTPGNLLRHLLTKFFLYEKKAVALADVLRDRLPDAEIVACPRDIRSEAALGDLQAFAPHLIFFATGDTNTDITMSSILPALLPSASTAFGWADPDLVAGHLIYQPAGARPLLRDMHDEKTAIYRHALSDPTATPLQESGCQTAYSPYSGLAMARLATVVAEKLIEWLDSPPTAAQVLRNQSHDAWEMPQ